MTPLRKQMIEVLELRGSSPKTVRLYVDCVARLAQHFGKSPEQLGEKEVRTYLLHLMQSEKVALGTYKQALAAIRFLYRWVLHRGDVVQDIRGPRPERRLPVVLSFEEVHRFFAAIRSFKYRTLLMFAYAAGLRVSEAAQRAGLGHRQPADGDSHRAREAKKGSLHDPFAAAVGDAPPLLVGGTAERLSVSRPRPNWCGAFQLRAARLQRGANAPA